MRSIHRLPVIVLSLSLALAACGGDDDGQEAAGTQDGGDTSTDDGESADDEGSTDAAEGEASGCDSITATEASEIYEALAELAYDDRLACMEERAAEEGQVVLYSSRDSEMLDLWQADFQEQYPEIAVEYLSLTGTALYERVQTEDRGGVNLVDIVHPGDEIKLFADEGQLATLHGAAVPEGYPDDGHGEWHMSFGPSPVVIAWNTDLVSEDEAPESWEDLLDPKWKGKVAIDTGSSGMVKTLVGVWGEEETRDYLEQLINENDAIVRKGHTNITNMLAAGEFPVAAELYGHKVESFIQEKGAPLEWAAADPTPAGSGGLYGIAAEAPHPYAAALFSHYMAGPRAGQFWADDGRLHLHEDVEPKYPRVAELIGDDRLYTPPADEGTEDLDTANELIEEIVVPAYTGADD